MAITSDEVREAVELYLPRAVNYVRSSDLAEVDREAVFQRLIQIILVALLVDKDAIFYLVYLSSQRLLRDINTAISLLETLEGDEQLRAVSDVAPQRISDLSLLTEAREDLLGLSGSLVQDVFGQDHFDRFATSLGGFLTDQVVPNVQGGNKIKLEADIRATMAQLETAWEDVLVRREKLFALVDKFRAADLRVLVASSVISSVQAKLLELEATLPDKTTSEHAQESRQILIELAAAQASLQIIAEAESPFGEEVVPPAGDGRTPATYLEIEGEAVLDPILPIIKAEDGRLAFDDVLVSETGQTVDDANPNRPETTKLFEDSTPAVDFVAALVEPGYFLTLVDTGVVLRIEAVTPTQLTLSPPTLHVPATDQRYIITQTPPGTYFRSDSVDFWDEYGDGLTPSSVVASGGDGSFPRQNKVEGSDGTNVLLADSAAINGGASVLVDPSVDFIAADVQVGDLVFFVAPNHPDNITASPFTVVTPAPTSTLLRLDAVIPQNAVPGSYEVVRSTIFVSATAAFLSQGVTAGDLIDINGVGTGLLIDSVDSQTQLTLNAPVLESLAGKAYEVYAPPGDESNTFVQTDPVDFAVLGIADVVEVTAFRTVYDPDTGLYTNEPVPIQRPSILTVEGTDHFVASRVSSDTLTITDTADREENDILPWSVRAGDVTRHFFDTVNAPFLNYEVGDVLVYEPGTPEEIRASITCIVSAEEIWVGADLPHDIDTGINYAVISKVNNGDELLFAGRRYTIDTVDSLHVLKLLRPTTSSPGKNISYLVVTRGTRPGTFLLTDESVPLTVPGGFPSEFSGEFIDIMSGTPRRGTVVRVRDQNNDGDNETLEVSFNLPAGQRYVSYRVRSETANTSNEFRTEAALAVNVLESDVLTVWGIDYTLTVLGTSSDPPETVLSVSPLLPSRLEDQTFVVMRSGSVDHGRYVLLEGQNAQVSLDSDTSLLRLRVAEVLIDFGSDVLLIAAGADGVVVDDSDDNNTSPLFRDSTVDFVAVDAHIGDRLTVLIDTDGPSGNPAKVYTTFVTAVVDENTLQVDPELPTPDLVVPLTWDLERNSVSYSLEESTRLREQLTALRDVLELYTIPRNETIQGALDLLRQQNMDRAVTLLNDGDFDIFLEMTSDDSSYASRARGALQTVGATALPTAELGGQGPTTSSRLAGTDPATGKSAPDNARAGSSSAYVMPQSGALHSALSAAVFDLLSDEQMRSLAQESLEESRNRAVFELIGEVVSGAISDRDPTLPWIAKTGSKRTRLERRAQKVLDALQYMLDHPDEFCDVGDFEP